MPHTDRAILSASQDDGKFGVKAHGTNVLGVPVESLHARLVLLERAIESAASLLGRKRLRF